MLIVEPLGMPTRHPQQAGDGLFGDLHEPGRRLTLQPSPRWWRTSSAVASGSLVLTKAVPRHSENSTGGADRVRRLCE
jgi:hypothetical protein